MLQLRNKEQSPHFNVIEVILAEGTVSEGMVASRPKANYCVGDSNSPEIMDSSGILWFVSHVSCYYKHTESSGVDH
jgi:hypothetical protein